MSMKFNVNLHIGRDIQTPQDIAEYLRKIAHDLDVLDLYDLNKREYIRSVGGGITPIGSYALRNMFDDEVEVEDIDAHVALYNLDE